MNVASRMDSTGVTGRIQITRETKEILDWNRGEQNFSIEPRGPIVVKGKGELTTYLLKTMFDFDDDENTYV